MEPTVVRTLKSITFECFRPDVCVYDIGGINGGTQVSQHFRIDGKLGVRVSSLSSFIFSNPGPEWYISTRLTGKPEAKHFVVHHPNVNLGTPEAPIYETLVPAKLVSRVLIITEETMVWSN